MEAELKLFVRRASKLQDMLNYFKADEWNISKNSIELLKEKVMTICTAVQNDGTLNAGGKFEWVDSILIKVLLVTFIIFLYFNCYFSVCKKVPGC